MRLIYTYKNLNMAPQFNESVLPIGQFHAAEVSSLASLRILLNQHSDAPISRIAPDFDLLKLLSQVCFCFSNRGQESLCMIQKLRSCFGKTGVGLFC